MACDQLLAEARQQLIAEASRCQWCEDDTLYAECVYKNGRLLCATCGLSCYIKEDRSGLERRATQQWVLATAEETRASDSGKEVVSGSSTEQV